MALAVKTCPNCQTQNISTAQFCGSCGQALRGAAQSTTPGTPPPSGGQVGGQAVPQGGPVGQLPHHGGAAITPANSKQWHEQAGIICGVLSIFLCGIIASIPGVYFSWSAMSQAKAQGRSSNLAIVGLVLNLLGILITFIVTAAMLIMFVFAASASADPYSGGYGGGGYGL